MMVVDLFNSKYKCLWGGWYIINKWKVSLRFQIQNDIENRVEIRRIDISNKASEDKVASLSSIFKKGWLLIFIMCWGTGGPSDVFNERPNKINKTQPHFSRQCEFDKKKKSRQCETMRKWRLPVRLLLFRLHRSI